MQLLTQILKQINDYVWGLPLICLLLGTGIYFTFKLRLIQLTKLKLAFKCIFKKHEGEGDVSSFQALCTALSSTIGTGNIVGVATAIAAGGPGALFWMWISAFFGMATKYAEGLLAIRYRQNRSLVLIYPLLFVGYMTGCCSIVRDYRSPFLPYRTGILQQLYDLICCFFGKFP